MDDRTWLVLATFLYLISAAWGAYTLGARRVSATRWNLALILGAFSCHSVFLYLRGEEIRHCPVTNLFEVLAFLSWSLVLTYLVIGPVYRLSILGTFTSPLAFLLNFFALTAPVDIPNQLPVMGPLVELHIALSVMSIGILGLAALTGLAYLIQERQLKRRDLTSWFYSLPPMGELEAAHRRVLTFAFGLFSIGLLIGFFIPHDSVSDWVKITWSGMVWALYGAILLAPRWLPLSHKKIAWCSVGGYVFVLLTFWGVNSFSSMHQFTAQPPASEQRT
ncbi:MAG: cytochrome c biogenesis protein CcsA [Verrucomicrobiota bacterium]